MKRGGIIAIKLPARLAVFLGSAGITYAGMGLGLISAPLLARTLGADGRGVLAGAFVLVQILSWVAFLGLPRGLAIQSLGESRVSHSGVGLVVLLGPISAVVAFVSADLVSNGDPRIAIGVRVAAVVLIAAGVFQIGSEATLLRGQLWRFNAIRAANGIIPPVGYIVAFLFGQLTLTNAYFITLGSQVAATVLGCVFAIPALKEIAKRRPPWHFSLRYWASSAFDGLGGRIDQLLLTALTSAATVGTYAVAVTCAVASGGLTQALNQLTYSRFADSSQMDPGARLRSRSIYGLALSICCGGAVIGLVALLGPTLFGPSFDGLLPITAILVIAQVFNEQWTLRVYFQSAEGNARSLAASSAIGLAVLLLSTTCFALAGELNGVTMACAAVFFAVGRLVARRLFIAADNRAKKESV
jgi:O-antigen/teichoic acid export membrane protein